MTAWQINVFSIILLITASVAVAVSFIAWKRRSTPGSPILSLLMLAVAEWAISNALESAALHIPTKILWSQIAYFGIHSIPPLFLLLALQYNQKTDWLTIPRILLIWLIPLIVIGLAVTNGSHQLVWADFSLDLNNPNILIFYYGPAFWVGAVYDYTLILIASWNMIWAAQHLSNLYRRQVGAITIAASLPWIGNLLYILNKNPFPGQGFTSITFLLMGIFLAWSMYRHQLFDFTPIARDKIVDLLTEAVIYIDQKYMIGDLNPAAKSLLSTEDEIIGKDAHLILAKWPYLESRFTERDVFPTDVRNIQDIDGNWYDLRISPLLQQGSAQGWLVILRDITEQKILEAALRSSEELYRNVTEKANDGIVILQDNLVIYSNPQLANLLGYKVMDIIGKPFLEYISPQQAGAIQEKYARRIDGKPEALRYESELQHSSGHFIPVEFNIGLMDHDGKPAILAIVRDNTEKSRSEKELVEYARQQKLLNEITHAAIQASELEVTLQILADRLGELFHADGCFLTLWDPILEIAIPMAAYGALSKDYKDSKPEPEDPTVTRAVLEKQCPIAIEDVFDTPHINPKHAALFPTKSILGLPLIANDQKLGAALIAYSEPHRFTDEEVYLGEQASQQISLAVLKARLLDTAQQRATEAETLRQAGAAVAATLKLNEAIDVILEQIHRVVPYDSASVQFLRENELEVVGQRGFDENEDFLGMRFPLSEDNPNKFVIEIRKPHIINNAPKAYEIFSKHPHNKIHGWMGVPLIVQDRIIGMLALDSHQPSQFTNEHARLASAFAAQVAIALDNAHLFEEAHRLSIIDPLTGIYNRRHFMTLAQQEYQRACRYSRPLSVIMMDIDHFKRVNDTFGHLIGDQVLRSIALQIQDHLRESDFVGRYGGEEFVILLPETPSMNPPNDRATEEPSENISAKIVAQRVCDLISGASIPTESGDVKITASLGVAGQSIDFANIETLLNRADTALYIAKQRGRNQVAVWTNST
ncbi:MAG: diguanylate cyclase [Anaerolineales bacterium]|nr:diguanylate cyclase [Chloroflexota bacterium]MBL6979914.1 diguanylate cyclase [Anaerolineales bacterium]